MKLSIMFFSFFFLREHVFAKFVALLRSFGLEIIFWEDFLEHKVDLNLPKKLSMFIFVSFFPSLSEKLITNNFFNHQYMVTTASTNKVPTTQFVA